MRLTIAAAASLLFAGNLMAATVSVGVTQDTFIQTSGGDGNINRGELNPTELWNYHNGGAWVATPLFFFDLSGYAGQTVSGDATFTVTVLAPGNSSTRSLSAVALTAAFDPETATHNNSSGTVNGSTLDSITTVPVAGGTVTFTIPQATIQSWIDTPLANYGFGVKATPVVNDIKYYASEAGLSTTPTLTFNVVPEPSAATLLGALGLFGLVRRRR
jgi:hypothetical protein